MKRPKIPFHYEPKQNYCLIFAQSYNFNEIGVAYKAVDSLTVTLNSLVITEKIGSYTYSINYTLVNNTLDQAIDEGSFKMFYLEKSGGVPQYGFFNKLYPGDSRTRSYTFEELKGDLFGVLQYHHDHFFASEPISESLKWRVDDKIPGYDSPPEVLNSIIDIYVDEDAPDTIIDLSNVFTDPDNNDSAITKSVQANSNSSLVSVLIDGNNLTLDYLENQNGTATITVRGTSNGKTVDDEFVVIVNPVNDAPTGGDDVVTTDEDIAYTFQATDFTYNDIDGDNFDGIKMVSIATAGNLVYDGSGVTDNTYYSDVAKLIFTPEIDSIGSPYTSFIFRVKDNANTYSDSTYIMTINVIEVDDPPSVINQILDLTTNEDAPDTTIDLSNVFTDPDNENSEITKSVQANSNASLLTASIDGNNLILDFLENQNGTAKITVRGTSNGKTVDDEFVVIVNPVNDAPQDFCLLFPIDKTILDITASTNDINNIEFVWENSIDPDSNYIEYFIYFSFENQNSLLFANIDSNSFFIPFDSLNNIFPNIGILEGLGEVSGKWFVKASDGIDTTECNEKFSITISNQHVAINNENELPDEFKLFQNYPNPFNPSTMIKYSLSKNTDVNLSIINSAGKVVDVLVNNKQSAGNYSVKWDAIDVPSGIYFYKILTNDFSDVKKCMLIK